MAAHISRDYSPSSAEKASYPIEHEREGIHDAGEDNDPSHHLHRGLKSRQITMIAIGGAIGTGLIIGTYVFAFLFKRFVIASLHGKSCKRRC